MTASTAHADALFAKHRLWGRTLLAVSIVVTVIYGLLGWLVVSFLPFEEETLYAALTAVFFPYISFFLHRYKVASERLNFVAITPDQYPEVFNIVKTLCAEAGITQIPDVFLVRDPSVDPCTLNAGLRHEIVLGTDFLAGCRENNTPEAVRFMLAHQVGHFVANHNRMHWIVGLAGAIGTPVFRTLAVRNLEFTADAYAAKVCPLGAVDAIALCATGKDNYPYVDPVEQNIQSRRLSLMGLIAKWTTHDVAPLARLLRLEQDGLLTKSPDRKIPDLHTKLFA